MSGVFYNEMQMKISINESSELLFCNVTRLVVLTLNSSTAGMFKLPIVSPRAALVVKSQVLFSVELIGR